MSIVNQLLTILRREIIYILVEVMNKNCDMSDDDHWEIMPRLTIVFHQLITGEAAID